ncbi:cytochrome P450 6a2-like [Aricia agestis]|uniref:cytochrome P450 6a2-like n=1 Tax=Aricia agestis TaxID=91739 RepID=UPI001C2035EE|nr:cytochrome P450 6a2-like [Aricia agestis]
MFVFFENELILVFALLPAVFVYLYFRFKYSYWSSRGVPGPVPGAPYGNLEDVIKRRAQFFQPYADAYFKYRHLPYVGMYAFSEPVLNVHDPDLAKLILITHFDHFQAHGIFSPGDRDSLSDHIFNAHGRRWRRLRNKLTPAFSSVKLKGAMPVINDITDSAIKYIDDLYSKDEPINISQFYEKFTMEIIGNVGFGVVCDGFKNKKSEFVLYGHEYFEPTFCRSIIRLIGFFAPKVLKVFSLKRVRKETEHFFWNLLKEMVAYRQRNNYQRNDYLQTLIDLKGNDEHADGNEVEIEFTQKDLCANMMMYMFAGYETSATTGQFAIFELTCNPLIQDRARVEIRQVLENHKGKVTYEALKEMTYLNMIIDETMRKYPPMRALFRRCTKDYLIPGTNVTIEKGTLIFIPIQAIQMDPEYFPNPQEFQPERFSPGNKKKLHPCVWMPFGEGPRKCLGMRQGYLQSKMSLVRILMKYEMILDKRTEVPITNKVSALANASNTGIWIRLKELNS